VTPDLQSRNKSSTKEDYPLKDFYSDIYGTYDRVNRIFTFGQDVSWRKKAARACLQSNPETVLDLCTGTGDLILEMAKMSAVSGRTPELTGYDFSPAMLEEARQKTDLLRKGGIIPPVTFMEGEVSAMPFKQESFDAVGITFGIRNLVYENSNAEKHLAEIFRVLRRGGRFILLESCRPENRIWRFFNNLYLRIILPYLGGLISGNLKAYKYLASSSRNYYSITEMAYLLEGAGFRIIKGRLLFMGSVMLLEAAKK
jgi:demethylmenaquinone methyltransferase / 2-methoxy-6-polyprenyl-1,4-benzoquinol methylase